MKNAKNIVLVGFRGTGKGAIGRAIAKKLGMGFFDTDKEIERRERKRIPEIFSAVGEQGFRKIEKDPEEYEKLSWMEKADFLEWILITKDKWYVSESTKLQMTELEDKVFSAQKLVQDTYQ